MFKITKMFLLLVFIFFANLVFAENGERVTDFNGKFSYCPPLGWDVTEFPGLKYKVALGPTEENFRVNINLADEEYNGSLRDYVDLNTSQLGRFFEDYKLLEQSPFRTNSGITGERVVINTRQMGFFLRQIFYFLQAPNNKYFVIACTVPDNVADGYLSIFEESMKTFEFTQ